MSGTTAIGEEGGGDTGGMGGGGTGGGGLGAGEGGAQPGAGGPPATEETRWRRRALDAEALAKSLESRLAAAERGLAEARSALDAAERRHAMDLALQEADALDLGAARLLTEAAVESMDEPDVRAAVDDLRRTKPFLFRRAPAASEGAAGASWSQAPIEPAPDGPDLASAMRDASTGDRRALLRYLRARRAALGN